MIKIFVSECLYGERIVRYDGGIKAETNPIFLKWKEEGRLIPFCPEVYGGLKIPRVDSQRRGDSFVSRDGRDVTKEYQKGARGAVEAMKKSGAAFAVMKENSPSCGVHQIHDGNFNGVKIPGMGLSTEMLVAEGFKVFSEKELEAADEYLRSLESI